MRQLGRALRVRAYDGAALCVSRQAKDLTNEDDVAIADASCRSAADTARKFGRLEQLDELVPEQLD
ncbi:MAG: hypothetical protein ACPIOQ_79290 [Promethearchaeia archaeon]